MPSNPSRIHRSHLGLDYPLTDAPTLYTCATAPCYWTVAAAGMVYCGVAASAVAGMVAVVKVAAYYCCGCKIVAGDVSTAILQYGSAAAVDGSAGGVCGMATVGCCVTSYCGSNCGYICDYGAAGPASNETPDSKSLHKLTTSDHWMAPPPAARLRSCTLSSSTHTPISSLCTNA